MAVKAGVKFNEVVGGGKTSSLQAYRNLYYGHMSLSKVIRAELLISLFGGIRGAVGLWLRSKLFPCLFAGVGRKVIFGANVTLRHPHKVRLGSHIVIDDNAVIDAKGETNRGITIGDNVFIGRNTIIYCKNGNIDIGDRVNISTNCQIVSTNGLTIKEDTVIGAYSYLLSGGEYEFGPDAPPFSAQSGMISKGELTIGANCWLGTRVTVLDGANVGEHCVLGAGAVVNRPIPDRKLAVGVPARVIKAL